MTSGKDPERRSLVFDLLDTYCARHGLRLTAADPYGHAGLVEAPDGRRWFFKGTRFDLNRFGSAEIAADKAYTATFLKQAGVPVPAHHLVRAGDLACDTPARAIRSFAAEAGFPLYVKPNSGREGRDVIRVDGWNALWDALEDLCQRRDLLLVQKAVTGRDLRVLVLEGEILCAIERQSPSVIGDGIQTLSELIAGRETLEPADSRIDNELHRQGVTRKTIPAKGQRLQLLPVANLSAGGTAQFVTGKVPQGVLDLARLATSTLGLTYAGIDLILPASGGPGTGPVVLEVNAAPGLSTLARQGPEASHQVEALYQKLFAVAFR